MSTHALFTLEKLLGKNEDFQAADAYILHPLRYPSIYQEYKKQLACFWTVDEVDLAHDLKDFENFSQDERDFILKILSFFASAEGIVNDNLGINFAEEVAIPEVKMFYNQQMSMESIHADMYGLLLQTYLKNDEMVKRLNYGVVHDLSIKQKADWAMTWMPKERPFLERLIAFACVEGIFFSASFCAIFWLKKQNKMHGLTFSNELISRDEGMHRDFAIFLYHCIEESLDSETILAIVDSAVQCECFFVEHALQGKSLLGMNSDMMIRYVKCVADNLLEKLHLPAHYNVDQPFEFMELISIPGKTNFFEKRVGDYQMAGVLQSEEEKKFALMDDF